MYMLCIENNKILAVPTEARDAQGAALDSTQEDADSAQLTS